MTDHIYILDDSYENSLFRRKRDYSSRLESHYQVIAKYFEQSNESEYRYEISFYCDKILLDKFIVIYKNFQMSGCLEFRLRYYLAVEAQYLELKLEHLVGYPVIKLMMAE